jgi:uncharacterized protein
MLENGVSEPFSSLLEARWQALRWLLLSPPLLSDAAALEHGWAQGADCIARFTAQERCEIEAWLARLRDVRAPEHASWLAAQPSFDAVRVAPPKYQEPHLRLGRLAESLLAFYLGSGVTHTLAVAHLPLRYRAACAGELISTPADRTTRGEIDFLLHRGSQPLHWELAVKYFLCTARGSVACARDFVGPEGKEHLDHKLHKLFAKQMRHRPDAPLSETPWHAQAFTRGWMFYRHGEPVPSCDLLDAQHERGWWVPAHGWVDFAAHWRERGVDRWQVLDRHRWMPRWAAVESQAAFDGAEQAGPVLVVGLQQREGVWVEALRCFVTRFDTG